MKRGPFSFMEGWEIQRWPGGGPGRSGTKKPRRQTAGVIDGFSYILISDEPTDATGTVTELLDRRTDTTKHLKI